MNEHPCETCLRWPECNGVDESCPLLEEVDHGQTSSDEL